MSSGCVGAETYAAAAPLTLCLVEVAKSILRACVRVVCVCLCAELGSWGSKANLFFQTDDFLLEFLHPITWMGKLENLNVALLAVSLKAQ